MFGQSKEEGQLVPLRPGVNVVMRASRVRRNGGIDLAGIFLYSNPEIASVAFDRACKAEKEAQNQSSNAERSLLRFYVRKFGEVPQPHFSLPGKHVDKPTELDLKWGNHAYSDLVKLRQGKSSSLMSHLGDLMTEYYNWQGHLVKRNIRVGKRSEVGWEMELDFIAYDPHSNHLPPAKPSLNFDSWADQRRIRD